MDETPDHCRAHKMGVLRPRLHTQPFDFWKPMQPLRAGIDVNLFGDVRLLRDPRHTGKPYCTGSQL